MAQAVSLTTIQATIARALRIAPDSRPRIERAAVLIALGHVKRINAAEYAVRSQDDPAVVYSVTPTGCTCEDARRRPTTRCKHQWAVRIVIAAEQEDARHAEQAARALETPDAVALAYARKIGFVAA